MSRNTYKNAYYEEKVTKTKVPVLFGMAIVNVTLSDWDSSHSVKTAGWITSSPSQRISGTGTAAVRGQSGRTDE